MRQCVAEDTCQIKRPDAFFGAAILLASVIEFEGWNIIDYSEDQAGSFNLGRLQGLEDVFIARCTGMSLLVYDRNKLLAGGLAESQISLLQD
jgi:hypothetical protein